MVVKVNNLWQHQLISLSREGHNDKDIFDAIRSSLHGKAGSIMVRLGTDATVTDILENMNSVLVTLTLRLMCWLHSMAHAKDQKKLWLTGVAD